MRILFIIVVLFYSAQDCLSQHVNPTSGTNGLVLSAEDGYLNGLVKGVTYQMVINPDNDSAMLWPSVSGLEEGLMMMFVLESEKDSTVNINFTLPTQLSNGVEQIPCSFGNTHAFWASSNVVWDPNLDSVTFISTGNDTFYLGITMPIPKTIAHGEYIDTVECSISYVGGTAIHSQSEITARAIFHVDILPSFHIAMQEGYLDLGKPRPGSEYMLIPGPGGDTVVPLGLGNSLVISVRGEPFALAHMEFLLPTTLFDVSGEGGNVHCSWGTDALYREDTHEFFNPNAPITFRFGNDSSASIRLGISVLAPTQEGLYECGNDVYCTLTDSAGIESITEIGWFGATFEIIPLQINAVDGDMNNLSPGQTYTLDPNPNDTVYITPLVNGTETGTPASFEIVGVLGANIQVVFGLPVYFVDSIGRKIPCSFSVNSAYWDDRDTTWDPNDPYTWGMTSLDTNGQCRVHLGITAIIPDTILSGTYTASGTAWFAYSEVPNGILPKVMYRETSFTFTARVIAPTGITQERGIPTEFKLEQNYPNPFNPSTIINYQLPISSWVTLKVYNVLGQEIATLVNEKKESGRNEEKFNAAHLPSGVYFYRLKAGEYLQTRKLVIME